MNNLKKILPFKVLIILFLVLLYCYIIVSKEIYHTDYVGDEDEIIGVIKQVDVKKNKISFIVSTKEKVLVNYYFKNKDEIQNIKIGYSIKIKGKLVEPKDNTTFNLFNHKKYLLSQKIYWIFKMENYEITSTNMSVYYKIKNSVYNRIDSIGKSKDYLKAFIIGDNKYIEEDIKSSYQSNGISHLLAISGMHITLLSLILLFILNVFNNNVKFNYLLIIMFIIFYMFLTGFKPPVIRASLLFTILSINKILNIKITTVSILISIACILLIYNPYYVFDLGFKFSFIVSFYLILFNDIFINDNYFVKIFKISWIAFLTGIPIMIDNFFSINLLSVVLNVIFVPLVSIVIFPLSLLTFVIPKLDNILYLLITLLENLSLYFSKIDFLILNLPKVSFTILVLYYVIITLYLANYNSKRYLIILIVMIFIHTKLSYFNSKYEITAIDVKQGDSLLVRFPYNKLNILIDTGGIVNFNNQELTLAKNTLIPYFKSLGINRLDYLILTHGDFDHMGESLYLIDNFKIKKVLLNKGNNNELENKIIKKLIKKNINYEHVLKNEVHYKNDQIKFLNKTNLENENEDSLITYMYLNDKHILFMADASKMNENYILEEYNLPKMDILKVGHHGSNTSTSENLLKKVSPNYAIISVGENNLYQHPHQETLDMLNKYNVTTYQTSQCGSVKFVLDRKIKVITSLGCHANA